MTTTTAAAEMAVEIRATELVPFFLRQFHHFSTGTAKGERNGTLIYWRQKTKKETSTKFEIDVVGTVKLPA